MLVGRFGEVDGARSRTGCLCSWSANLSCCRPGVIAAVWGTLITGSNARRLLGVKACGTPGA